MEGKWAFMFILLTLTYILIYIIINVERTNIMNNWVTKRCELPIVITASYFKPLSDKRSTSEFTKENFEFCMKSYVDSFMSQFLKPILGIFNSQSDTTNSLSGVINGVKKIAATLYGEFSSYVDSLFKKVYRSTHQISRIVQYLQMAINRMSGIAVSMIYTGLTVFRGILNTIQFTIKIILIVCAILIALIIILWFILFPIIPIILTTLGVIIYTVSLFSNVMSSSIQMDAQSKQGGFCIAEWEKISVYENNKLIEKDISKIKVGDILNDCGIVTTVIKMKGKGITLYDINGINLSGTHLIYGTDGEWKSVINDERSIITHKESSTLYCFNTTSNKFPVIKNDFVLYCRDWEEIPNDNIEFYKEWEKIIYKKLNNSSESISYIQHILSLIGNNNVVKTKDGYTHITDIEIGSFILDNNGKEQEVLGIIEGQISNSKDDGGLWIAGCYVYDKKWNKENNLGYGTDIVYGRNLITETGEFIIYSGGKFGDKTSSVDSLFEKRIRDFTEIGYMCIDETYSFIESILRIKNISNK